MEVLKVAAIPEPFTRDVPEKLKRHTETSHKKVMKKPTRHTQENRQPQMIFTTKF